MRSDSHTRVGATFLEVVEKLTFMFGEAVPARDLPPAKGAYAEASLAFSGQIRGRLAIAVPNDLMPEIAGNILGLDPEDVEPGEMRADALRELLNVVSGHLVMVLASSKADFQLSPPGYRMLTADEFAAAGDDPDTAVFMLDESPVLLNLKLE